MLDWAGQDNRLQVWRDWEDRVHQAGMDGLFPRKALLLRRRNRKDVSAAEQLFAQRHGGIVPRQICAEEVEFDGLRTGRWYLNQHVRPGGLGILVSVLVLVCTVKWGNFLQFGARVKEKETRWNPLTDGLLASLCAFVLDSARLPNNPLENRCTLTGTVGSNPTASANNIPHKSIASLDGEQFAMLLYVGNP
jgi:hypothetical protein